MSKETEALKMALEALVEVKSWKSPTRWDGCFDKEITAIKKALSSCQCPECKVVLHASDCAVHNELAYSKGKCNCGAHRNPLTNDEVNKLVDDEDWYNDPHGFVRAIEAKLKEKNT